MIPRNQKTRDLRELDVLDTLLPRPTPSPATPEIHSSCILAGETLDGERRRRR
jgi:hypothetical protein